MNCDILKIVSGNDFSTQMTITALDAGGNVIENFSLEDSTDVVVKYTLAGESHTIEAYDYDIEGNDITIQWSDLTLGKYGFEIEGKFNGYSWRSAARFIFQIVADNASANIPEGVLVDGVYKLSDWLRLLSGGGGIKQVQADWTETDTNSPAYIQNKPNLNEKQDVLVSGENIKTINNESILGSGNIEFGGDVESVNGKTGVVVLDAEDVGAASAEDVATLQAAYEGLTESDIIPMQSLPASGVANTIYRISGTTTYSDYMWDGTDWVKLAEYDNCVGYFDIDTTYEEVEPAEEYSNLGVYNGSIRTSSDWKAKAYLLNPDEEIFYRTGNGAIAPMGAIGTFSENVFTQVQINDLVSKYPPEYLPSIGITLGDMRSYILTDLYYKNDTSEPLYLILNSKYITTTYNPKVYKKVLSYNSDVVVKPKDEVIFDNYDYIKERACVISDGNLTEICKTYKGRGVVYNTGGEIKVHSDYDCYVLPTMFATYYSFYDYKGLATGAKNIALLVRYGENTRQLKMEDFVQNSTWVAEDTFFTKTGTYPYRQDNVTSPTSFSFKIPSKVDFTQEPDEICVVMNCRFSAGNLPETFYIAEGSTPKQSTGERLVQVFGYDINNDAEEQHTSDDSINGKVVAFFGDSITSGTDDGYVNLVKDKAQLASALNYGSSGAGTARLVDIVTGYNIRESGSYSTKDYNTFSAVTIMIGTNGGVSGNITNDIPDISISDINSFPYDYTADGKTISSATLQDENDFFKLCFANTFYGNIALCLEYIQWKNPDCRVYLITIPPSDRGNHIAVRDAMLELGKKMGFHVIDAQTNAGMGMWNITMWSKDKTHLNYKGNEMLASYLAKELENQFYSSDVRSLE